MVDNPLGDDDASGREGGDDTIVYLYEDGDIFGGAHPDRILFTCRIRDENGYSVSLQADGPLDFSEKD